MEFIAEPARRGLFGRCAWSSVESEYDRGSGLGDTEPSDREVLTRFLPALLAWYSARSARSIRSLAVTPGGDTADANAGRDAKSDQIRFVALIGLNSLSDPFGDRAGALGGPSWHHDRELFSAEPRAHRRCGPSAEGSLRCRGSPCRQRHGRIDR